MCLFDWPNEDGLGYSDIQQKMVAFFMTAYSNYIEISTFLRFDNNEKCNAVEIVMHNAYGEVNNSVPTYNGECWL
jgi:hypothetical protein